MFKGEQLLEKEGDYILQLKIYYEDTERWTQPPERVHVNKNPLVELSSPSENGKVGYKFRIEAKESNTASASYSPELKGLADGVMTLTIRYGSDITDENDAPFSARRPQHVLASVETFTKFRPIFSTESIENGFIFSRLIRTQRGQS